MQHQSLYNNTQVGNWFTGLFTKWTGNNSSLVITAQNNEPMVLLLRGLTVNIPISRRIGLL
jgi:hypothetical protein